MPGPGVPYSPSPYVLVPATALQYRALLAMNGITTRSIFNFESHDFLRALRHAANTRQ